VRCWFAPHDLPIGAKTWDAIDAAIRVRDKLLLILSKNAITSNWVKDEVSKRPFMLTANLLRIRSHRPTTYPLILGGPLLEAHS
jgi:hypothetical protein